MLSKLHASIIVNFSTSTSPEKKVSECLFNVVFRFCYAFAILGNPRAIHVSLAMLISGSASRDVWLWGYREWHLQCRPIMTTSSLKYRAANNHCNTDSRPTSPAHYL